MTKCRHSVSPRSEEAGLESSNPEPTWRQMRVPSSSILQLFYRQPKPRFLGAAEASRILAKYPDRVPVICATWLLAFRGLKAPTKPSPCETSCQPFQGLGFKGLWVSRLFGVAGGLQGLQPGGLRTCSDLTTHSRNPKEESSIRAVEPPKTLKLKAAYQGDRTSGVGKFR